MRLPEQRLYDWLRRRIGHVAHLTRVESRVGRDIPDLFVAFTGWQGWVEMKVLPDWPKRTTTAVRLDHWTSGQRYWSQRHRACGGRVALLVEIGATGEILVFRAADVATQIDTWTRQEWNWRAVWAGNRNADNRAALDAFVRV